jgi:hypothetical protein
LKLNEEKFVKYRHLLLLAAGLILGIAIMQRCRAADDVVKTEWRSLAFTYTHGKYDRVIDMFDKGFETQHECILAVHQGIEALRPAMKDGDGIVGACVQVPVLT